MNGPSTCSGGQNNSALWRNLKVEYINGGTTNTKANLCCVRWHKASRGRTELGSHHLSSQGCCIPGLKTVCRWRKGQIKINNNTVHWHQSHDPFWVWWECACTCSSAFVCVWQQQSFLHLWCSAQPVRTLCTSPSQPSRFLWTRSKNSVVFLWQTHVHTLPRTCNPVTTQIFETN